MNIFVGNLSFDATEGDAKKLFEGFGNVASVVIVMRKEKKTPKSRGFGFVQMPDEQQALAAIDALNGKEFMGRVLNVNPARPNPTGIALLIPIKEEAKEEAKTEAHRESKFKKKAQPGTYKGGRRTRSYMIRRGLDGMQEEAEPRQRSQDNPMRWRKRKDKPMPWQKSPGEHKPWEKAEGDSNPWSKSSRRPQKYRFKGSKNPDGYKR